MQSIVLAELSNNAEWYDFFPFYANVWMVRTNNNYTGIAAPEFELENIGLDSSFIAISFYVRKKPYSEVATISEVILNDQTFYYNKTDRTLLVHFENHKPFYYWDQRDIEIGFILGFYYSNADAKSDYNDSQYLPRLKPVNLIGSQIGDVYFGKQVLPGNSIKITNDDLYFKNFNTGPGVKKKNGNFVRILVWTGDDASQASYTDFDIDYQGVISDIDEGSELNIKLADLRSSLTIKSPDRYLDTTNYPDIKDPDKEYLLPQVWGKCERVPCISLNENVNDGGGSTAYEFLLCDTINHTVAGSSIKKVFINGKETSLTPTVSFDTTQDFAKFSIASINFAVNDGASNRFENMDKVDIEVWGYLKGSDFKESDGSLTGSPTDLIENGMAIMREIIKNNYGFDYVSTFFDITTWKSFEDTASDIGYYKNSQLTTQKQMEELAASQLGEFLWDVNLKFSFKNNDFSSFVSTISKIYHTPKEFKLKVDINTKPTIAILRTGFKKKWAVSDFELGYEWDVDISNETRARVDFNSFKSKNITTFINNSTDAAAFKARVIVFAGISVEFIDFVWPWEFRTLKAGEWVKVQLDYPNDIYLGWAKCQVQTVKPRSTGGNVAVKVRVFGYYPYLQNPTTGEYLKNSYGELITGTFQGV